MPIFVEQPTRVICQGLLTDEELFHVHQCKLYGTQVVAWVKAGFGGQERGGLPIFDSVWEARRQTNATASLVFVEPHAVADAVMEAVEGGIGMIICLTSGVPLHDMVSIRSVLVKYPACRMVGPGSCGIITPPQCKAGVMPAYIFAPGPVGIVTSVDTLGYEAAWQITSRGFGQTTFVGLGDEPIRGLSVVTVLDEFHRDETTEAVLMMLHQWEKEGDAIAEWLEKKKRKPHLAVIAGHMVPYAGHHPAAAGDEAGGRDISGLLKKAGVRVIEDISTIGFAVEQAVTAVRLKEFS